MKEFLDRLASKSSVPGGGSVSALSGALAASLGLMVCNLSDLPTVRLETLKEELEKLMKEDEEAFKEVMKAYKKKNKEKKEEALKEASRVPLRTAEKCLDVLKELKPLSKEGKKSAITDVAVAAVLAESGIQGAIFNIRINHKYIKDEKFIKDTTRWYEEIVKEGKDLKTYVLSIVEESL